ncbi:zinc ribbon domain-containing protein, partial [Lyngbya aestuarii]|uniref:zinc ribbon domain-containing protein n=2 Tax=Lyngbya aestuarii TaxID=118322 RepID=UPI00058FA4EC
MFVNFMDYKLRQKSAKLIEVDRFFPSSKTCSCCGHIVDSLPLNIREWDCLNCKTHHDRDSNAALNIRNEGIRIIHFGGGNPVSAEGACLRPDNRDGERASG